MLATLLGLFVDIGALSNIFKSTNNNQELIEILELRARSIIDEATFLSNGIKDSATLVNFQLMIQEFKSLHQQNMAALNANNNVLSHELTRQIHSLTKKYAFRNQYEESGTFYLTLPAQTVKAPPPLEILELYSPSILGDSSSGWNVATSNPSYQIDNKDNNKTIFHTGSSRLKSHTLIMEIVEAEDSLPAN